MRQLYLHAIVAFCSAMMVLMNMNVSDAQTSSNTLKGVVLDPSGQSMAGATVVVKNLQSGQITGAITDGKGQFQVAHLDPGTYDIMTQYLGYGSDTLKAYHWMASSSSQLKLHLGAERTSLSQLVVTGYGTERKKDLTGAVSVVNINSIKNIPVPDVNQMLKGKVSGVLVTNDYAPGGSVAIRIRGFGTIGNNDPLYIIDGVPTNGGLNMINPNDIASIQILKDASSASIYGSRAANGVVIITTKQGKSGLPEITFSGFTGVQQPFNLPTMLSAQHYGDLLWQATKNDGGTPANAVYGTGSTPVIPAFLDPQKTVPSSNVQWIKEIFHPAIEQSYNLSVSKGSQNSHQYFSLGYFDQDGILKYTGFKRLSSRINSDTHLFNRLTLGENVTLDYTENTGVSNNSVNGGLIYDAIKFPSISPVYDLTGNFGGNALNDAVNPLGILFRNKDNKQKTVTLFGNAYADVEIIKGLHAKSNVGIDYSNFNFRDYSPKYMELGSQSTQSSLTTSNDFNYNLVWSNTLTYDKTLGKSQINALAGTEAVKYDDEGFSASRKNFPYDDLNFRYLDAGNTGVQTNSGSGNQWTLLSFLGKVNYNYDQRYLASATFRRDGSSKLGTNKWGNFPALSLGWRLSNESFFHIPAINDLKLRFGWGANGNQDIPTYSTIESYISDPNNSNYAITGSQNVVATGLIQSRIGNPDLKWETTTQTDYGMDLTAFNGALQFTADYFNKKTTNMLIESPLPPVSGGTNQTVWINGGEMTNKGIEMEVSYQHSMGAFSYSVGANFSAIKNKLVSLPNGITSIAISSSSLHSVNFDQQVSLTQPGEAIGEFFGYRELGLFQSQAEIDAYKNAKGDLLQPDAKPGDIKFADVNGDGVIDGNDRTAIGSPLPKFTYGFNADLKWKQFDLSLFIQGSYGNKIYDLTRYYGDFYDLSAYNKFSRIEGAWTPSHTQTGIPRLSINDPNNNIRPSSYFVQNGSYARLKNLQVGYTFQTKGKAGSIRVYAMAQNLLTLTHYQGMNPEVGLQNYSSSNRNLDIGVDRGLYPPSKVFTLGLNLNFK